MATCIACAEQIKDEAKLCKHCGTLQSDGRFRQGSLAAKAPNLYAAWWIQLLFLSFVLVDPSTGLTNPENSLKSFIPDLAAVLTVGNTALAFVMLFVFILRRDKVPGTSTREWFQSFSIFAGAGVFTLFLGIVFLMP